MIKITQGEYEARVLSTLDKEQRIYNNIHLSLVDKEERIYALWVLQFIGTQFQDKFMKNYTETLMEHHRNKI